MTTMMTAREIVSAIVAAKPQRITIDAVHPNGDVLFHVSLKDCGLDKDVCACPTTHKRFFVNFVGELLVRENIEKFAEILWGLDPALERKMVYSFNHTDFGMTIDHKMTAMTFQMHLSLVREITTELFGNGAKDRPPTGGSILDDFDASKPPEQGAPTEDDQSSEE